MKNSLIPLNRIQESILTIRGRKVMLDRDLAVLFEVETKRLNEQVKRNIGRFPPDFMFQLTPEEKDWVVSNCDHLRTLKFSRTTPFAFTEHGAVMLASILNTEAAVKTSLLVVRAFIELRKMLVSHEELARKINALEMKYDVKFNVVFKALKQLIDKPNPERRAIGFKRRNDLDDS
jgi:hypothetical protein